jgi:succinate dehydrogenase / fumarate reductase cytochrome b subunit
VFIIGHLAGNLLAYAGPGPFNAYANTLHHTPLLLWSVRIGMIVLFPLHIWTSIRCSMINEDARPMPYAYQNRSPARAAAKSMLLSGGVILAFFAYHIAHFTWRMTGPQPERMVGDVFDAHAMLVAGFQVPWIAAFYVIAQILLAGHLSHGIYSLFQHLGLWGARWTPWLKNTALVVGYAISAAFASIPLAVQLGVIK